MWVDMKNIKFRPFRGFLNNLNKFLQNSCFAVSCSVVQLGPCGFGRDQNFER